MPVKFLDDILVYFCICSFTSGVIILLLLCLTNVFRSFWSLKHYSLEIELSAKKMLHIPKAIG